MSDRACFWLAVTLCVALFVILCGTCAPPVWRP